MQRQDELICSDNEDKVEVNQQPESAITTTPLPMPSDETILLVQSILDEQNENPSSENLCKGLFKTIYACLDSKSAHIYNSSRGLPTVGYEVMVTEPGTFGNSALKIYAGGQLFLVTAMTIASVFSAKYKNQAYDKLKKIYKHLSAFSNGFSFAYSQSCLVAAQIEGQGNLPSTTAVYTSLGIVLGESFAIGLLDAYASSLPENSMLRKCTESLVSALTFGNTFSQAHRIYNFFNGPQPKENLQTFVTCIPLIISAGALLTNICFRRQDLTLSARLGTVNNILSDFGTLVKAKQNDDVFALVLMGSELLVSSIGYCLIKHYDRIHANANMNQALLANEAPSQAFEDSEPESPSTMRPSL